MKRVSSALAFMEDMVMADNWNWENLSDWDWWTSEKDWLGPNMSYGLAGLARAFAPKTVAGNVGEMMQQYIQGQAAQKAFEEQMIQRQQFFDALAAMLGQGVVQPEVLGARSDDMPDEWGGEMSSRDWLSGGDGLIPSEEQIREAEIQRLYGDNPEVAEIARQLSGMGGY